MMGMGPAEWEALCCFSGNTAFSSVAWPRAIVQLSPLGTSHTIASKLESDFSLHLANSTWVAQDQDGACGGTPAIFPSLDTCTHLCLLVRGLPGCLFNCFLM